MDLVEKFSTSRNKASKEAGGADDTTNTMVSNGSFELLGVLFFDKISIDEPLVGEFITNIS